MPIFAVATEFSIYFPVTLLVIAIFAFLPLLAVSGFIGFRCGKSCSTDDAAVNSGVGYGAIPGLGLILVICLFPGIEMPHRDDLPSLLVSLAVFIAVMCFVGGLAGAVGAKIAYWRKVKSKSDGAA